MNLLITIVIFLISVFVLNAKYSKPDLIIVLDDDLGYGEFKINGSKKNPIPDIEKLADGGINFTHGDVSDICSRSQEGLLTGRNKGHFEKDNNLAEVHPGFDEESHKVTVFGNHYSNLNRKR